MPKKKKIRQRSDSLFDLGLWSFVLFGGATLLGPITGTDYCADLLSASLHAAGLTWVNNSNSRTIGFGIAMGIMFTGATLARWRQSSRQGSRDSEIRLPGPKALFLRPFFSDKKFLFQNPFRSSLISVITPETFYLGPEEFVGRVLEPYVSVMEIGGNPRSVSGGKIFSPDENWRDAFAEAVESATFVVVMPMLGLDSSSGRAMGEATIWELRYLVESGRISRTIAIMPKVPLLRRNYARQCWERTRLATADFGLTLPEYKRNGAIMLFERGANSWNVAREFVYTENRRGSLAAGLVEAVEELSGRNGFTLLNR